MPVDLTEDFLIKLGGYAVFQQARVLLATGKVSEAVWAEPILRGKVLQGGKARPTVLKIHGPREVEIHCSCPEARRDGKICVHAVAVGLAALAPAPVQEQEITPADPIAQTSPTGLTCPTDRQATTTKPEIRLQIEGSLRHLEASLEFVYQAPNLDHAGTGSEVLEELEEAGFVMDQNPAHSPLRSRWKLTGEPAVLQFYAEILPAWQKKWRVRCGERFLHVTRDLIPLTPSSSWQEGSSADWLDFRLHFQAGADAVLSYDEVRRLLAGGQNSITLRNGRRAVAPKALLAELEETLRDINPNRSPEGGGRAAWRIPSHQAEYLRSALPTKEEKLQTPSPPPVPELPPGIHLRPYQEAGFHWMADLAERGLGGLLADEMGLGKTLQALSLLALRGKAATAGEKRPHLVVCPSSLVWNWQSEAARFFPQMRVVAWEGGGRHSRHGELAKSDLVVTSYALLRRDVELLAGQPCDCLLLDEAQQIKNPASQNARAAARLQARARFVLTGTPLENSLRDLWSLVDFALPGYLGSVGEFRERYQIPLEQGGRHEIMRRLRRRLAPYFLRREKRTVLPELPPRIEQTIEIELTPLQKRLYDQIQAVARQEMDALRAAGGGGAARMRVLTALLRLRQICCDARLVQPGQSSAPEQDESTSSGKLAALLELVSEAVEGGHRILVFSQFTSLLDLVEPALARLGVAFLRLDGSTRDRAALVGQFQKADGPPVFLLSLKAGGSGLNLTAADQVIHLDPWWNPAVEAQATDRAHRIGQDRVVTSIKLIARDTVEARVLRLQEEKRELFNLAVDGETAWQSLSTEDLAGLLAP